MSATFKLHPGDCIATMRTLPEASIDAIVTDPPYELGFMGKAWDASGIANNVEMWAEALRVLKPGGHLLAFSGSRTYHRMVCAIEDAGFEIRDQIMWVYGSGFPKSLNVAKAVDSQLTLGGSSQSQMRKRDMADEYRPHKGAGTEGFGDGNLRKGADGDRDLSAAAELKTDAARQWQGWGTALKPAHEPIVVARKPLIGTVAANVLAHGTGALNIDGCRVPGEAWSRPASNAVGGVYGDYANDTARANDAGRWPANLIHDGSDEVLAAFPQSTSGANPASRGGIGYGSSAKGQAECAAARGAETGSAGRFFYAAKASKADRGADNVHPTVKPTDLMAYLVRLVTPPGGTVLDPFTGSGSTGKACMREGFNFIGCELSPEYLAIAKARIEHEQLLAAQRAYDAMLKAA